MCAPVTFFHLHSIMYLLIPAARKRQRGSVLHLHSIMYLLIPFDPSCTHTIEELFTFHNVSINSLCRVGNWRVLQIYIP